MNFADAKNSGQYAQLEPEIWGPFINKQMKAGTTNVVSWAFSTLIIPRGRDVPHDAVSVDGFNSVADALGSNFKEAVKFPERIDELMAAHDKVDVELYRLVATVEP